LNAVPLVYSGELSLSDPSLIVERCYVGGQWISAADGRTIRVNNPSTGAVIADVPSLGGGEVEAAIVAADMALPDWRSRSAKERSDLLRRWFDLCIAAQEDLARILTAEQGKPLAEARGEIAYGAAFIDWFAGEARRVYGDIIPSNKASQRILVLRQPVGVVAAITPWNFPNAMITRKAGAALAAGCTIIIKPASATPLSALALALLAERAGIPAGVINLITGSAGAIGGILATDPRVRKISFTGSTEIGRTLLEKSASTIKKVSMELGGNAPFIVFDDADLDRAIDGVLDSKFRNAGQTCVCANRIFVQSGIYRRFAAALVKAVETLSIGDGMEEGVQIGPLIDEAAILKVEEHIADAVGLGGVIASGGARHERGGHFFTPTVLTDVSVDAAIMREETFGPVAPLVRFETEEEVVRLANDTEFGLAAYLYTSDLARSWRVAEALESGMVGINEGLVSSEVAPFGGVKQSGLGREGSRHGVEDYLEMKYLCIGDVA
jgi:succinate-semialdehyde dehydrogenase/glutarate-semialdehyde dehydrogenase